MNVRVNIVNAAQESAGMKTKLNALMLRLKTVMRNNRLALLMDMRRNCPKRTGATAKSIKIVARDGGLTFTIESDNPNVERLEFGTPPHWIFPRFKKALYWAGALHPVRKVFHPGTKAHPYIMPAVNRFTAKILADIERVFKGV
jgi:hypothetical protein